MRMVIGERVKIWKFMLSSKIVRVIKFIRMIWAGYIPIYLIQIGRMEGCFKKR